MKTFDHEWILEPLTAHRSFFTKRMFGGLAAYLHERLMLVLVEPTKTGRWLWHGVLVGTDYEHHASIGASFPALAPHDVLRKWLYIDSTHADFESTMEAVVRCMARNDRRFGVAPLQRTRGARSGQARPGVARGRSAATARPRKPR
jgi:hypothetical protein